MSEREVVLDEPLLTDEQAAALRQATERAEHAEAELAKLKARDGQKTGDVEKTFTPKLEGEAELRKDSMMAHLLDSLQAGTDIGHYGRLVFAMVARHFMPHDEVLAWMMKDKDVDEAKAEVMLRQVEGRDYNPPRREKILEYQKQQEFPILPDAADPDCGNLYRNLKFPDGIYQHIEEYREAKLEQQG